MNIEKSEFDTPSNKQFDKVENKNLDQIQTISSFRSNEVEIDIDENKIYR